ncbi:MAG TPA: ADP-ribosylglycohydrolase family protein [Steroidobacteraceae bacterium]|nr:ADP-ribosylglycohydrolase family protein [Steroidobacteraceae bacterium]
MMTRSMPNDRGDAPPRPVEDCYWLLPGRLLVGAYPGSRSRAQAMDRLRRLLEAGVTCFVDLTEPDEIASYETLLPFETPGGRRVEHLREPIVDHGVPASRETMARILAMIDGALDSGHTVYLHCRAGIGRSAMAAGCWLAERSGDGEQALRELAACWPQATQSQHWPRVPETDEQVRFVLEWPTGRAAARVHQHAGNTDSAAERLRGAWYGLALGDAACAANVVVDAPVAWTQHTALALCLADSLIDKGGSDARDQIERYLRWQRVGDRTATGTVAEAIATPDVARALATYLWRRQPMAGAHDPRDASPTSLPRVLAPACFAVADPAAAVAVAAEAARTTHQSPLILEACRLYAAMLVGALRGEPPSRWLESVPAFEPSPWTAKPLRKDVLAIASAERVDATLAPQGTVLHVLLEARRIAQQARDFGSVIEAARLAARKDQATAPYGALAGTLYGAMHGSTAITAEARARLAGNDQLDAAIERWLVRGRTAGATA